MTAYVSFLGHMNASYTVMLAKIQEKLKMLIKKPASFLNTGYYLLDPQIKPPDLTPRF